MITSFKLAKLENLFQTSFSFENLRTFKKLKITDFHCSNCTQCRVDINSEPIYTPYTGDENTKIMIIGEAPSRSGINEGPGPHIGGDFNELKDSGKSPITEVREFVKENYSGTVPYCTDMIKCGVAKQNGKNAKLSLRAENCIEKFLRKEIKIIEPDIIFCTVFSVYDYIIKMHQIGKIDGGVRIIKLIHYSRRGSLLLSIRDKRELIWKVQAGLLGEEDLKGMSILELSAVKKYLNTGSKQLSIEVDRSISPIRTESFTEKSLKTFQPLPEKIKFCTQVVSIGKERGHNFKYSIGKNYCVVRSEINNFEFCLNLEIRQSRISFEVIAKGAKVKNRLFYLFNRLKDEIQREAELIFNVLVEGPENPDWGRLIAFSEYEDLKSLYSNADDIAEKFCTMVEVLK